LQRRAFMPRAALVRGLHGWTSVIHAALAAAVVAAVVVAAVVSGALYSSNNTLIFMGFDAERAQLITSLLVAGVGAAAATIVTNRSGLATLSGVGGLVALFGYTFLHETKSAMASTGVNGSFDLTGWVLTLVALLLAGGISSWAGATLAQALRPALGEAGSAIRDAVGSRRPTRRLLGRPLTTAAVLVLLILTVPVFGDMVNYTPDSRMLHGGPPPVGLVPGGAGQHAAPAAPSQQPWLSWRPSGGGSVTTVELPAPWTDSSATTEDIEVYTPPGYEPTGSRRYPVLYEAPFNYALWDGGVNIKVVLDTLITAGTVPPMIVVFVNAWRAPIADTECANSVDGQQWMDTFISETVVSYVDSHYLTIARAEARATTGFSQGGYCAAILALRHPTVFGTAIPISAYYWAGDGEAGSRLPFGSDLAALAAASPMIAASQLPAATCAKLFFIVVAQPSQPFFGAQATEFEHLLAFKGYPFVGLDARIPHGWDQVRAMLPPALEAWAGHLVAAGVF
jgi:enterochelin esterase-like enzyme